MEPVSRPFYSLDGLLGLRENKFFGKCVLGIMILQQSEFNFEKDEDYASFLKNNFKFDESNKETMWALRMSYWIRTTLPTE